MMRTILTFPGLDYVRIQVNTIQVGGFKPLMLYNEVNRLVTKCDCSIPARKAKKNANMK